AVTAGGGWRVYLQPMGTGGREVVLLTAAPLAHVLRGQREAKEAEWGGVPYGPLVAAAGGLWAAGGRPPRGTRHAARARGRAARGGAGAGRYGGSRTIRPCRRARPARARLQRARRAPAPDAPDAASVHGGRVARVADAGVGDPVDVRRHAGGRKPAGGGLPRGAGRGRKRGAPPGPPRRRHARPRPRRCRRLSRAAGKQGHYHSPRRP